MGEGEQKVRIENGANAKIERRWYGWIRGWPWDVRFLRRLSWIRADYRWRERYWSIEIDDHGLAMLLIQYWKQRPLARFTLIESQQLGGDKRADGIAGVYQIVVGLLGGKDEG